VQGFNIKSCKNLALESGVFITSDSSETSRNAARAALQRTPHEQTVIRFVQQTLFYNVLIKISYNAYISLMGITRFGQRVKNRYF
jgi:hypothetical protein